MEKEKRVRAVVVERRERGGERVCFCHQLWLCKRSFQRLGADRSLSSPSMVPPGNSLNAACTFFRYHIHTGPYFSHFTIAFYDLAKHSFVLPW